ncbi:MAG: sugar phosphate isomerase/epimerase family protein [Leadbetterella sp.]
MNRRRFFSQVGYGAGTLSLLSYLASCKKENSEKSVVSTGDFKNFGIQLWTVRNEMAQDPKGTLKKLSEFGYNQIESFGGDKGIFWGMSPKEFTSFTKDLGLHVFASHCDPEFSLKPEKWDAFKKLGNEAAEAGLKYLVNPYVGFFKTKSEYLKGAETFNKQGEYLKSLGLRYAYHNHHYSFKLLDGEFPQDIMMKNTDPNLMDFEMDIYWVASAGQNPEEWIKKYPNRFKLFHVKDIYSEAKISELAKTEKPDPQFGIDASCVLGTGRLDFSQILRTAIDNGGEYFAVEQERYDNSTPIQDAKKDAEYFKKLVLKKA